MTRVAICDDDINLLSTFKKVFKKIGYEVFICKTAAALYKVLETTQIDIVIVDFNLDPEDFDSVAENGLEIIRKIRNDYQNKDVKLVLTTTSNYADIDDVKKAGGDEILFKPIFPLTKITDLLAKLSC